MTETRGRPSFLRRLGAEPVVHFGAIAVALFGVSELMDVVRPDVIQIDPLEVEWRVQQLERGRGAPLDTEERELAERAYIDEQILAREARDRGLDDDQRIRSILSQKMLHVLSGGTVLPTDAELRHYYATHEARYALPPSVRADVFVVLGGRPVPEDLEGGAVLERSTLDGVTRNALALAFGEDVAGGGVPGRFGSVGRPI